MDYSDGIHLNTECYIQYPSCNPKVKFIYPTSLTPKKAPSISAEPWTEFSQISHLIILFVRWCSGYIFLLVGGCVHFQAIPLTIWRTWQKRLFSFVKYILDSKRGRWLSQIINASNKIKAKLQEFSLNFTIYSLQLEKSHALNRNGSNLFLLFNYFLYNFLWGKNG